MSSAGRRRPLGGRVPQKRKGRCPAPSYSGGILQSGGADATRFARVPQKVFAIVSEPLEYPRWWQAVYLAAEEMLAGQRGVGRRVRFHTRGWLPYTLRWESVVTDVKTPHRLAIRATGDLEGRGIWSIVQDGEWCDITFDWKLRARTGARPAPPRCPKTFPRFDRGSKASVVRASCSEAEKPLLAALSFALKPMFEANHRWAMACGEESLELELARIRARAPAELSAVPPPGRAVSR